MMGYQPQLSKVPVHTKKQNMVEADATPTPVPPGCKPQVLIPNSSESSMDQPSPSLSVSASLGIVNGDLETPSQNNQPSIVKLEFTQSGHGKAVLRKDMKKDHQMNAIFEQIHMDFYLLAITSDLFIENRPHFKPTIRQLASDMFHRLHVTTFNISDNLIAMVSIQDIIPVIAAD